MTKMIAALEAELQILNSTREAEMNRAKGLLERESGSRHLGHNLGNVAVAIAEVDAKILQTERILGGLRQAEAEAK